MLKHGEPNPLAVFNLRRIDFCPPHFQTVDFLCYTEHSNILNWIYENTEGRFYYGAGEIKAPTVDRAFQERSRERVGFETHSEAAFFALLLDHINKPTEYNY